MVNPVKIEAFKGINNRIDPVRLGLEWQLQADNCLCDDANYLTRRPGVTKFTGSRFLDSLVPDDGLPVFSGTTLLDVHGTRDGRLLVNDNSHNLIEITEAGETTILHAGITGAPFQWAELGYALFLMSATARWAVYPDRVIVWGSLCPSAATDSYPMGDPISYPPPVGHVLGVRREQLAVAVWEKDRDRSVLYLSRPGFPHEFRLERDYQIFAGRITLLADTSTAFLIATDRAIYLDPYDAPLMRVADYGVPLGGMVYDERDVVWFWSERGLCKAAPFENLTDKQLVVEERQDVTAGLLPWQGSRYVVVQQTGPVTTRRSARAYEPMTITTVNTQGIS